MKVSDLIHSYNDLLPEPSERHAEVIRLDGPDYKPTVLAGFEPLEQRPKSEQPEALSEG